MYVRNGIELGRCRVCFVSPWALKSARPSRKPQRRKRRLPNTLAELTMRGRIHMANAFRGRLGNVRRVATWASMLLEGGFGRDEGVDCEAPILKIRGENA